jgi:MvaI/BcnI restriction endonuclease family
MKIYTKETLIEELKTIRDLGFVPDARHDNHGGIGNTLEDLLGIEENNLPIPNAAEWELKTQRLNTSSLLTLFHTEPSPQALRFVPSLLTTSIWLVPSKSGQCLSRNRDELSSNDSWTCTIRPRF